MRTDRETQAMVDEVLAVFKQCGPTRCITALWDWHSDDMLVIVLSNSEHGIPLRYQDMPRIAAALGTERLDFGAFAGNHYLDSYTFEGSVLEIVARYGAGKEAT